MNIKEDDLLRTKNRERRDFQCKRPTNWSTEPYYLLSSTLALGDLVDTNPVVELSLHESIHWSNFPNFFPCPLVTISNHLSTNVFFCRTTFNEAVAPRTCSKPVLTILTFPYVVPILILNSKSYCFTLNL